MRPLIPAQQAEIAKRKALVEEHLPEAVVLIKQFFELGMIDGWRSVVSVTFTPGDGPDEDPRASREDPANGYCAGDAFCSKRTPGK